MPCYGCGTGFGAFKKEHGCKNCGMAFCMKCMPNKYPIAKLNNEKHRVCMKCYNILTGKIKPENNKGRFSPPENYKKRMAALEEKEARGQPAPSQLPSHSINHNQPKHMSAKDFEIQQRLEKLKEKTPQEKAAGQVSEREIDDRLAKLKGMDPARYRSEQKPGNQKFYHPPDRRSQQEQMNDLLDEIRDEVDIEAKLPDPTQEIENRLAQLRDKPDKPDNNGQESDENNLNKPSLRDSQSFSQNISNASLGKVESKSDNDNSLDTSTDQTKPSNSEGEDPISPEEINKILSEAAHELEEDAKHALKGLEEDKEIMRKLQQIKQKRKESQADINKDEALETSDSENEDQLADDAIKQALEEIKLDEAAAKDGIIEHAVDTKGKKEKGSKDVVVKGDTEEEEWYDPDELPYCCICTEDAVVRCMGCDRDLYCNGCFREGHKKLGLDDHVSIKYTPPKSQQT